MKILVFGGNSKLGMVFKKRFLKNDILYAIRNNKTSKLFKKKIIYNTLNDLRIINAIQEADLIVNFTGESINIKKMTEVNIFFIKKLVRLINIYNKNCILVHLSTCAIYQDVKKDTYLIDEKTKKIPIKKYPRSKFLGEQHILNYCKSKKIVLRPAQILGDGMSNQSLYRLKYYIEKNLFFYINDHHSLLSYTNIEDVINFFKVLINKKKIIFKSINIVSTIKIFDLIQIIKKKYKIVSFQPTINIKFLNLLLKFINLFGFNHPLNDQVIKSLTWKINYSSSKVNKLFTLSKFDDVKF